MTRVSQVHVMGLFGHAEHTVRFRQAEPTIVLAPNGAGKTNVLRLTAAALSLDARTLLNSAYRELRITFTDGRELIVDRRIDDRGNAELRVDARPTGSKREPLLVTEEEFASFERDLPAEIRQVASNRWRNERTGRMYSAADLERLYRVRPNPLGTKLDDYPELEDLLRPPRPVFIDTWRLDARSDDTGLLGEWGRLPARAVDSAESRIRGYTDKLREEISEARRASIRVTQTADLSFAARALSAANLRVNEVRLHERYDSTVERYETLARNGLAVGEAPIPFPVSSTPTVRRILSVFLDDWDKRLEPLLPVNEKLQVLRDILDSKLGPSGKRTGISSRGGLEFYSSSGARLPVSRLSSGEQHLVALFTLLLFAAKRGSLVLIDEPEISLHAAWKHAFLTDISRVAEANSLQVVLATHSAGIVNGRWDLVEELELPRWEELEASSDLDTEEDEEDIDV